MEGTKRKKNKKQKRGKEIRQLKKNGEVSRNMKMKSEVMKLRIP